MAINLKDLNNIDLKNIDLQNLHQMGKPAQLVLAAVIVVAIWVAGWFLFFSDQWTTLKDTEAKEATLKEEYASKSIQAANFDVLKQELADLSTAFSILLKQLPTAAEIPNVLQDLHQAASANGMRLSSLTPKAPVDDGSIQTLPYDLVITGQYDQVTQFVRDVGGLSRIITLDTLNLKKDDKGQMTLSAVARTYRAKAHEEQKPAEAASDNAQPKQ